MSSETYERLRQFFDRITPTGFPKTRSGVELRLMEQLFTPEQAETVVHVTLKLESPEVIAKRMGKEIGEAIQILDGLADDGLIMSLVKDDVKRYMALPFAPGVLEQNTWRMTGELAKLWNNYMDEALDRTYALPGVTPVSRTLPVAEAVSADHTILPYEKASELIEKTPSPKAVTECICRKFKVVSGEPCGKSMEACIAFGPWAANFIRTGAAREIDNDELRNILKQCNEAGLVLNVANWTNFENLYMLCNCCSCCCGLLRAINKYHKNNIEGGLAASCYLAFIDKDTCSGCEICIERCQTDALHMDDGIAALKKGRCIGCGLCVTGCPDDAITLVKRREEDIVSVPNSAHELYKKIYNDKKGQISTAT